MFFYWPLLCYHRLLDFCSFVKRLNQFDLRHFVKILVQVKHDIFHCNISPSLKSWQH